MPSFSIEAQGEANPLTSIELWRTLTKASGVDVQTIQVATEQLRNWEGRPGFYSLIQDVYTDLSVDQNVRFQAIIQLKNGVEKHWRKTSPNAIGKPDKEKIRSAALEFGVVDPIPSLALQNALMLAKIVRNEFPHDWPNAITQIIAHLRSSPQRTNILLITLQVIKELASGKLQRTRKSLEKVSGEFLDVLKTIYLSEHGQDKELALKSIRRLLVAGFEHPHRDRELQALWLILHQFGVDEFQLAKLHLQMAQSHPASFVLLPGMVSIIGQSLATVENGANEKLILQSLLLLRACVKLAFHPSHTFKYQHPKDKEDRKLSVDLVKSQVFQKDFVIHLIEVLVTQYFPLNEADLQEWQEEPDEFTRRDDESSEAWEFSIRPCSEKLFLDLAINFKPIVIPKLKEIFEYSRGNIDIFQKESFYSAIGNAAPVLEGAINFNLFLPTLAAEIRTQDPLIAVLQRRVAIMISQWVPVTPEILEPKTCFEIFAFLLSKSNDHVVRLTAGRQLCTLLEVYDSAEFDASTILGNIMELMLKVENVDSKMTLLSTIRVALLQLDDKVEHFAADIMALLSQIWTNNPHEYLLHQTILSVLTALVAALKSKSAAYMPTIIPLIRNAVTSESQLYLLDEALGLWITVLQYETVPLFDVLLTLFEMGSNSLEQVMELCQDYIRKAPVMVLTSSKQLLIALLPFLEILGSRRGRQAIVVPAIVEQLAASICKLEAHLQDDAFVHLVQSLFKSGFLAKMMGLLKEAYNYYEDPKQPTEITGPAENALFNILAQLCLINAQSTIQIMDDWVVKEWLRTIDSIGDVSRKKVQVLALTNLFQYLPLQYLQEMLTIWTDSILEINEQDLKQVVSERMNEVSRRSGFNLALSQADPDITRAFSEVFSDDNH